MREWKKKLDYYYYLEIWMAFWSSILLRRKGLFARISCFLSFGWKVFGWLRSGNMTPSKVNDVSFAIDLPYIL